MIEDEQQPPNALVKIQLRVSDIPILLDALESRLEEFGDDERCGDPDCAGCANEHGALVRMRNTLFACSPKVRV